MGSIWAKCLIRPFFFFFKKILKKTPMQYIAPKTHDSREKKIYFYNMSLIMLGYCYHVTNDYCVIMLPQNIIVVS